MAYYILPKGFALRGWKGLPFALQYPDRRSTDFFNKEEYRVVYALDGRHDIDRDSLTDKQQKFLDHLVQIKIALPSDGEQRLDPYQEYKCYPGIHKNNVQWSITGRCNYKCRHCFMSAPDYRGKDLTLEQCTHILDEFEANGVYNISLTGGEPLVNPHFFDILDEMRKRDLWLDTIYSNSELVNEKLLDELEKRNMHPAFHMSFDGLGWHDWLRGIDGAEETLTRKFKLLRERGYQISSSMCLHKHNIGDLKKNIDAAAEWGLRHLKMNVASPTGRWKNETEHFLSQDEANQAIIDYIPQYVADGMPVSAQFCGFIDFNKERRKILIPSNKFGGGEGVDKGYACGAVTNGMYISPTGKVLPCMTLNETVIDPMFPSILEKPLAEILSDSFYHEMSLLKMRACIEHNEKCRDCKYRLNCGAGCRACACGETSDDYLGIDEDACSFFQNGWFEKAVELQERYKDSFPPVEEEPAAAAEPAAE